jgi:transposase
LDKLQTNTTPIAQALCVESKKLWRWYRDSLSGFLEPLAQEEHHRYDFEVNDKGRKREIRVPILKTENIGANMAIDEKQIGEDMHTVLSNRDSGKIAMLARTLKAKDLSVIISQFEGKGFEVKSVTRDLSNSYDWFCRQAFPNAGHIADKFHIISTLLEAEQDIRVRYRQELLRERRLKFEAYKLKEKQRESEYKRNSTTYPKRDFQYKEERLANGETSLELLARSRYLLFKYEKDWTPSQAERAEVLFAKYPQIKKAYYLTCSFRKWYRKENVGSDIKLLESQLEQWFQDVDIEDIEEISNFKSLVERNKTIILRYFIEGATNAIAENINSKISRFIMINQGTRDREFFYFRMGNYFS